MRAWFDRLLNLRGRVILYLASRGALSNFLELTTVKLAEELGISQQSASRVLIELEREGLVERGGAGRVWRVRLTERAARDLLEVFMRLKDVFESMSEIVLEGVVFTGLGEGAYYTRLPQYVEEFERKLGFRPYPGTLNLRLISREDVLKRMMLEKRADILIERFSDGARTCGGARCIRGYIDDEEVYLVFPERTHHPIDVVEIIAPICLRERFNLRDGDRVTVRVKIRQLSL